MRLCKLTFLPVFFSILFLASCAMPERDDADEASIESLTYSAWRVDEDRQRAAVRQLVIQADELIAKRELSTAESVLNRALRISNRIASIWSRLAWLASEQKQYDRSRNFISKSNSLTDASSLLRVNWELYLLASRHLGDEQGQRVADQKLQALR